MIVPKIDDWVECRGFDFGPRKAYAVDTGRKLFKALFLD
jgi:hypothetical protein